MSDLLVSEHLGFRTLHFGSEWVQGRMRIARPDELALGYAQDMCAALLFVPPPRDVYVAGLGVGALPRWALAHWGETLRRLDIVEIREDVIALAQGTFPLPLEDARLRLAQGDAAAAIRTRRASSVDWIWVDCYDGRGRVGALESSPFYEAAHRALRRHGVLVANLWSDVPRYRGGLRRLSAVFGADNIVLLPAVATENVTVIASKAPLPALDDRALQARARALRAGLGLPFERWLKAMSSVRVAL